MEPFLIDDQRPDKRVKLFRHIPIGYLHNLNYAESRGHGDQAVSSSNARGALQIKPIALKQHQKIYPQLAHIKEQDLMDPGVNMRLGSAYLDYIGDSLIGSIQKKYGRAPATIDPGIILMGYRIGPENVRKALMNLDPADMNYQVLRKLWSEGNIKIGDRQPTEYEKNSVVNYIDNIDHKSRYPKKEDLQNWRPELKKIAQDPFLYQLGDMVVPQDEEDTGFEDDLKRLQDNSLVKRMQKAYNIAKGAAGSIGNVVGAQAIEDGNTSTAAIGNAVAGFAEAGLPGALIKGVSGYLNAYVNKGQKELAYLNDEENKIQSKKVGLDKGFPDMYNPVYAQNGKLVVAASTPEYKEVIPLSSEQVEEIENLREENFKMLDKSFHQRQMEGNLHPRGALSTSVHLRTNPVINPLIHRQNEIIKSQRYGALQTDRTFLTEAKRLSPALKKFYSDVQVQGVYGDEKKLAALIKGLGPEDQLMLMDHSPGDSGEWSALFGLSLDKIGDILKDNYPKNNKKICYMGSCHGEEFVRRIANTSGVKIMGTNKLTWEGGDPRKKSVEDILFPKIKDRKIYTPEKKQKGGNVNTTGYTPGTSSYNNSYNVIPGNVLTMKDTPFDILGIPDKGKPRVMKAGLRKIVFPGARSVTEIPLQRIGDSVEHAQLGKFIRKAGEHLFGILGKNVAKEKALKDAAAYIAGLENGTIKQGSVQLSDDVISITNTNPEYREIILKHLKAGLTENPHPSIQGPTKPIQLGVRSNQMGGEIQKYQVGSKVKRDTIFPTMSNQYLFDKYKKFSNLPYQIVHE